jgi:hypothetical protein
VNGPVVEQPRVMPVPNVTPGASEIESVVLEGTCHTATGVTAPLAGNEVALKAMTHTDTDVVFTWAPRNVPAAPFKTWLDSREDDAVTGNTAAGVVVTGQGFVDDAGRNIGAPVDDVPV